MINLQDNNSQLDSVKNFLNAEALEKRTRDLLHAIDESSIVAFADINGKINYVNDKFCEITGYDRSELIGENHRIINSGYHSKEFFSDLWKTIKSGKIWKGEIKNQKRDGTFYWVFTTIVPILNERGRPREFLSIRFDITDKKKLEEECFVNHTEMLKDRVAREASERFVSTLTHDLRTPLTVMKLSTLQIERALNFDEGVMKHTSRILQNISRTEGMVTDLLNATKIRAGQKISMAMDFCDANEIAQKTIEELSLIHGPRFDLCVQGNSHGIWSGVGIKRIIENLCGNAIKYGDKDKAISIGLLANEDSLTIKVHNWGQVLNKDEARSLFDYLQRAQAVEEGNSVGWGIGLTIVKGIAESHGGAVDVASSLEKGTTFIVILPRAKNSDTH